MGEQFKPGDVVRLKSGGPKMTVVKFGSYRMGTLDGYLCQWFDTKGDLKSDVFTEEMLETVAPESFGGTVPSQRMVS